MANEVQNYMSELTLKGVEDLVTAFKRIPTDMQNWSPQGDARSAADMIAECAILNGATADTIKTKSFDASFDMEGYVSDKANLAAGDADVLISLLHENAKKVAAAIKDVPDSELTVSVQFPWASMTVSQIIAYPQWNMGYHEGQINYIASMLGCLE